ncbi:MAG: peroxide stress protein YaaA [Myxococcota bacterium]|nr:peroxide stress protein YaaA [Myxococcota bacterium]
MYAVLSPAKRLNANVEVLPKQKPTFWTESRSLAQIVREMSSAELQSLMKISPSLGDLNRERFQSLSLSKVQGSPAFLTFAGDTYIGLSANTLTPEQLAWSQTRIGILSGLYGLLRPLDPIEPYRLEMGTKLKNPTGGNLYTFWGDKIRQELEGRLENHQDKRIINLASDEYFKATGKLSVPVVNPVFKDWKNGKYKVISFSAKRARGRMARYIIDNKIERSEDLKAFDCDRYRYSAEHSDQQNWVFLR